MDARPPRFNASGFTPKLQMQHGIPFRWGANGMPEPQSVAMSGDCGHSYRLMICLHAARLWVRVATANTKQTHVWPEQTPGRGKSPDAGNIGTSHTQGFSRQKVKKFLSLHLKDEKFLRLLGGCLCLLSSQPVAAHDRSAAPDSYMLRAQGTAVAALLVYDAPAQPCVHFDQLVRALGYPLRLDGLYGWAGRGFLGTPDHYWHVQGRQLQTVQGDQLLAPEDLQQRPQGACVRLAAFRHWSGLEMVLDDAQKTLDLTGPQALAIAARARQLRRDQHEPAAPPTYRVEMPYRAWRAPSLDISGETQIGNQRSQRGVMRYTVAAAGELAHMSTRVRVTSNDHGTPINWSMRALRYDAEGQLLGPLGARQIAVGDINARLSSLVNASGSGRGAFISNEDMDALQGFSRTQLRGPLAPGWDVELYRNGELLGYAHDDGSGYFLFSNVPLSYGSNIFEIIRYGPQGQQQSETRRLRIGQGSVAQGQWHYWLGALQDETALSDLVAPAAWRAQRIAWRARGPVRATAMLEHGLRDTTSVSLQWHHLPVKTVERDFLEIGVRHMAAQGLLEANMAYAKSWVGQIGYSGNLGKNAVQLSWMRVGRDFQSDYVPAGLRQRIELGWEKNMGRGRLHMPLSLGMDLSQYISDAHVSLRAQISAMWDNISISQSWSAYAASTGVPQPALNSTRINWRVGAWRVRGEARYHVGADSRLLALAGVADRSLSAQSNLRFEITQERTLAKATRLRMDYSQRFTHFSLGGYALGDNRRRWQIGVTLSTSFGPAAQGWGQMHSAPQSTQALALVRVCMDENENNACDATEAAVPDIGLISSNGTRALSDAAGRALLESQSPWQYQHVRLDPPATPDAQRVPVYPDVLFMARPGIATPLDFPLRLSGRMTGQILGADRGVRIGVDMILEDAAGQKVAQAQSDAQGLFDFPYLRSGCYRLRLEDAEALRLGVHSILRDPICIAAQQPHVLLGEVVLPPLEMVAPPVYPAH